MKAEREKTVRTRLEREERLRFGTDALHHELEVYIQRAAPTGLRPDLRVAHIKRR